MIGRLDDARNDELSPITDEDPHLAHLPTPDLHRALPMIPIDSPLRASSSAIVVKSAFRVDCPANCVVNPSAVVVASTSRTPSTVAVSSCAIENEINE